MKFIAPYLVIYSLLIISISCGSTVAEEQTQTPSPTTTTTPSKSTAATTVEPIEDFIKGIDENLVNLKKEELEEGECHIEKYTSLDGEMIKVETNCYDGSLHLCRVERYYKNRKAYIAKIYFEEYNASPFDKENFDESKTIFTQRLVFFKDGDLNTIDKILDENNVVATIEGDIESGWEQAISF